MHTMFAIVAETSQFGLVHDVYNHDNFGCTILGNRNLDKVLDEDGGPIIGAKAPNKRHPLSRKNTYLCIYESMCLDLRQSV